jgi:hypothetical protein
MEATMHGIRRTMIVLAASVLLLSGCGIQQAAARQKQRNLLTQIGLAYHNCNDALGHGPVDLAELKKSGELPADAAQALQNGDVVLIWEVRIPSGMPQGAPVTVLGYEKDVPTKGGLVLMGDASVVQQTAAEYEAAPKAQPKK